MGLKEFSWKTLFTACWNRERPTPEPKLLQYSKPISSQRLCLSDLSNPGSTDSVYELSNVITSLHIFSLKELKVVTNNFSKSNYLGEGGFGAVFKGFIDDKLRPGLKAQVVAVKILDLDGSQGHREWLAEVIFLGQLKHPHLVNLVGYCCEDKHRLLVYEYMERGSLEKQLFDRYSASLPWLTRLKIAIGAAKGLAILHGEEKPIIFRDFKGSNILLDPDYNAKLSDFGLATDGPDGDQTHITTRVMGTEGYAAPEYIMTGHLTTMSDVFSFGVVLLELLTGRRSVDKKRPSKEQNLVKWARPFLKDPYKLDEIMDPRLEGQYSTEGSRKAAALAYQCLSHHCKSRPIMSNVVKTLEPLLELNDIPAGPFVYIAPMEGENGDNAGKNGQECQNQCNAPINDGRAEGKNLESKDKGYNHRRRKGNKRRYRIKRLRSRAIYSDTDLYKALGTSLYSPRN